MAVISDTDDLERAFRRHTSTAEIKDLCRRTRLMALFYAAECGLKLLFMNDKSIENTDGLRDALKETLGVRRIDLHDLEQLCHVTCVNPVDIVVPLPFQVSGSTHESYRIHEAARYGIKLSDVYLSGMEKWLENVNLEIKNRMSETGQ